MATRYAQFQPYVHKDTIEQYTNDIETCNKGLSAIREIGSPHEFQLSLEFLEKKVNELQNYLNQAKTGRRAFDDETNGVTVWTTRLTPELIAQNHYNYYNYQEPGEYDHKPEYYIENDPEIIVRFDSSDSGSITTKVTKIIQQCDEYKKDHPNALDGN